MEKKLGVQNGYRALPHVRVSSVGLTPALMKKITRAEYDILRSIFEIYRKPNGHLFRTVLDWQGQSWRVLTTRSLR